MAVTIEQLDRLCCSLPPHPTAVARVNSLCMRPGPDLREERTSLEFCPERGAIGDRWEHRTWLYLPNGKPDPRVQVAICNSRVLALIQAATGIRHHPGDTVFTDLDLSSQNLPAGTRLRVGLAVLEISDVENDACAKFAAHYGAPVLEWIRLPQNRPLRLRGLFARIVSGGLVHVGDLIVKLERPVREHAT
jgi:hypothetical protein